MATKKTVRRLKNVRHPLLMMKTKGLTGPLIARHTGGTKKLTKAANTLEEEF